MYENIIPKNYNPNILFTGPIMSKISFLATVLGKNTDKTELCPERMYR